MFLVTPPPGDKRCYLTYVRMFGCDSSRVVVEMSIFDLLKIEASVNNRGCVYCLFILGSVNRSRFI